MIDKSSSIMYKQEQSEKKKKKRKEGEKINKIK